MVKFTIRELLLLTLVVGLAVAWWLDRSHLERARERNEEKAVFAVEVVESLMEKLDYYAPEWRQAHSHL